MGPIEADSDLEQIGGMDALMEVMQPDKGGVILIPS